MDTKYYVVKMYSWTDRQQLWKIMSRPITNKFDAEIWKDHVSALEPKAEFFVVSREVS
jgi:hypothetical protein